MRSVNLFGAGLAAVIVFTAAASPSKPAAVFTPGEIAQCGHIRIPDIAVTPTRMILVAQCRDANTSKDTHAESTPLQRLPITDNMLNAKVVTKSSTDGGNTWHNWTILTPISYSHGALVYDAVNKQVVLQYQHHPNADPELNSTMLQRVSADDGLTWGPEIDITPQLRKCNPQQPLQMQVQSAGSKIQTSWGRIMFTGHNSANQSCVWWTDDGGKSYQTSQPFPGNEISVAQLLGSSSSSDGSLLVLNGRGLHFPWAPNRTQYYSSDGGDTWTTPAPSILQDNSLFGCEAPLLAVSRATGNRTLYFSEPTGSDRSSLVMRCSLDGGQTWPHMLPINGNKPAAYSALANIPTTHGIDGSDDALLVVWESGAGLLAESVETSWCV
jgi:Neuraminidase (sialidase)